MQRHRRKQKHLQSALQYLVIGSKPGWADLIPGEVIYVIFNNQRTR